MTPIKTIMARGQHSRLVMLLLGSGSVSNRTWGIAWPSKTPGAGAVGVLVGGKTIRGMVGSGVGSITAGVAGMGDGVMEGVTVGQPPASAWVSMGELIANPTRRIRKTIVNKRRKFLRLKNPIEDFAPMDVILSTGSGSHDQALRITWEMASIPDFPMSRRLLLKVLLEQLYN
jgi:hypothetical protein